MTRRSLLAACVSVAFLYGSATLYTGPTVGWMPDFVSWIKCVIKPHLCED